MDVQRLRHRIRWHREYRAEWDDAPGRYVDSGKVGWGKSRRIGYFKGDNVKAYLGVQHIDPNLAGWSIVEAPVARYFASFFLEGQVVTLRTFPTLGEALEWLAESISGLQDKESPFLS